MTKRLKITIDESLCSGHKICIDMCPHVFEVRNDEILHVISSNSDNKDCAAEAAESCPNGAIILEE